MQNAEKLQKQNRFQPNRRAVLQGGAALAAATVLAPASARADSHEAEMYAYAGEQPHASIARNVVETDSGKVAGYESGGILAFKGIPYADTTGGPNRFLRAARPKPWTGVRSAWHWGWVCPQPYTSSWSGRRTGWQHDEESFMFQWTDGEPDEDCLRINVWTPGCDASKRPVMFWIHGGGFTSGHANELATYDGEELARRGNVVVVSVNHRLGPLGFLNLSEFGSQYADSGIAGMLDLVDALQWVKTNIGSFGGDSGRVLIFGQSGGGGKVSTLMGMPAARGLFHRAVIESSGTPIRQIADETSRRTTAALLKELGIDSSSLDKLRQVAVEEILEASVRVSRLARTPNSPELGFGGWGPVVDGRNLPRDVWAPSAPEASSEVPLLVGSVLNEMGNSVQMGDAALEGMSMDEVKTRLARQFRDPDALIEAIQKAHTIHKPFDIYSLSQGLPRRVDVLQMASLKTEQGKAPAYVYKFVWQSPMVDGRARAYHCSELPFVFYNAGRCSMMTGGGPEAVALAGKISDAWINFARSGNPNHPGLPQWPAFSPDTKPTMVFDSQCALKTNYDDAQVKAAENTRGA